VAGCESLPTPGGGSGLAATGTPIVVGLAGLLLIVLGWLVYRRSARSRSAAEEAGQPEQTTKPAVSRGPRPEHPTKPSVSRGPRPDGGHSPLRR
jgi:hypothetical protein